MSIKVEEEEFYNPSGYADYLSNKHYHHSDKGCQIEMTIEMGNRPGEPSLPGVVKKCLTHNCICSKTGWEKGWYQGTPSISTVNYCECGKEIELKKKLCYDCLQIHKKENKKRELKKRKDEADFARRMRERKNAEKCQKISTLSN